MRALYLLRHGKSSWVDTALADRDRPLAPRGERAAKRMAGHIRREGIRPGLVLCSTAARARQTLEIIAPALGDDVAVRFDDQLYEGGAEDLLGRLRELPDDVDAVMVVGHNPALQELAVELVAEGDAGALCRLREKYPTGALATLTTTGRWSGLDAGGTWLESLVVPHDLAR